VYTKMVVLLDGSELAEVVFDYAQEISGRMHVDMDLLHVVGRDQKAQLPMRRAYIEKKAEELCARAEAVRIKYNKHASGECIMAHGHIREGYPADEILKYVEENDIDLVMMSTHGSSGVKRWDLGDVANKVVRASKVPVWLVPVELRGEVKDDLLPDRPLVVPLSGTPESETAIPHAIRVMRQRGAESESELVLLHVVESPYVIVSASAANDLEGERAQAKMYLERVAKPIRASGLKVRTEVVVSGEPGGSIIDYLKENPSQLVVMATRGKSRLSRTILGSVSESVINMMKMTPLLLVAEEA